ncbi:MAG: hypothetical protein NVV60_00585 [Luteimonas sp.]|nr:hypothetical protein [Luteimonas sp.]
MTEIPNPYIDELPQTHGDLVRHVDYAAGEVAMRLMLALMERKLVGGELAFFDISHEHDCRSREGGGCSCGRVIRFDNPEAVVALHRDHSVTRDFIGMSPNVHSLHGSKK